MKQWEYVTPPTVQEVAVRGHSEQSANAEVLDKLISAKTSSVARKLFICYLPAVTYWAFGGSHPARPGSLPACLSWRTRLLGTLMAILGLAWTWCRILHWPRIASLPPLTCLNLDLPFNLDTRKRRTKNRRECKLFFLRCRGLPMAERLYCNYARSELKSVMAPGSFTGWARSDFYVRGE